MASTSGDGHQGEGGGGDEQQGEGGEDEEGRIISYEEEEDDRFKKSELQKIVKKLMAIS